MSEVLERAIQNRHIDFETFEKGLIASGRGTFLTQHLKHVAIDHSNGIFAGKNDVVERLTGQKPQTIKEFISEKQRNVLLSTAAYFGVMSTDARVVSQSMRRLQPLPDLS